MPIASPPRKSPLGERLVDDRYQRRLQIVRDP
jgi:hypothetical protein